MPGLSLFNPWVLLAWLASLLAAVAFGYFNNDQAAKLQAQYDRAEIVTQQARARRVEGVHQAEADLAAASAEDRRKLNALHDRMDARVADLARQLRERPERPAAPGPGDVPAGAAGPGPSGACTGAGLYRDDGVFLVGQARMCQDIRLQRDEYYEQYRRAQQRLRALGKD